MLCEMISGVDCSISTKVEALEDAFQQRMKMSGGESLGIKAPLHRSLNRNESGKALAEIRVDQHVDEKIKCGQTFKSSKLDFFL